jgi:methionyl-tRNA formyltransferase
VRGAIKPQAQDNDQASYVRTLTREDGRIDWHQSAQSIARQVRAMSPWPGSWTIWNDKQLKIVAVEKTPHKVESYQPGYVFLDHGKLAVQTEIDALIVSQLQLEGKRPMTAEEFLRGNAEILHSFLT